MSQPALHNQPSPGARTAENMQFSVAQFPPLADDAEILNHGASRSGHQPFCGSNGEESRNG
jgi:hypothetical protein